MHRTGCLSERQAHPCSCGLMLKCQLSCPPVTIDQMRSSRFCSSPAQLLSATGNPDTEQQSRGKKKTTKLSCAEVCAGQGDEQHFCRWELQTVTSCLRSRVPTAAPWSLQGKWSQQSTPQSGFHSATVSTEIFNLLIAQGKLSCYSSLPSLCKLELCTTKKEAGACTPT